MASRGQCGMGGMAYGCHLLVGEPRGCPWFCTGPDVGVQLGGSSEVNFLLVRILSGLMAVGLELVL